MLRLADSFAAIDYFEHRGIPFAVAVNCFDGARAYGSAEVAGALDLDPDTPILAPHTVAATGSRASSCWISRTAARPARLAPMVLADGP